MGRPCHTGHKSQGARFQRLNMQVKATHQGGPFPKTEPKGFTRPRPQKRFHGRGDTAEEERQRLEGPKIFQTKGRNPFVKLH